MITIPLGRLGVCICFVLWWTTACAHTVLGLEGARLTINGRPTFLLGASYYGALGASEEFLREDLGNFQQHGFNWLRVWATWESNGTNVSAVDPQGRPREPFIGRLKWLIRECDRRGLVLDVTLTRGKNWALPDFESHQRGVETLVHALKGYRNWYLDLANEHDVRDARYVPDAELKLLAQRVRALDPKRLLTASFGGGDPDQEALREVILRIGVDILCPHRPRLAGSPEQTEAQTKRYLDVIKHLGRSVPVLYQEPFRRGYGRWEPVATDFWCDLRGALAGGAAGWCFHNGQQQRSDPPYRCFDLTKKRFFDQLDSEELKIIAAAKQFVSDATR